MKNKVCIIFAFLSLAILSNSCQNQDLHEDTFEFQPYDAFEILADVKTNENLSAFMEEYVALEPSCANIPTIEEVKLGQWAYIDKFYSQRQAYKAGIPIANLDLSRNITVYVRDYTRMKPCQATDGETIINYGQVIRTVIEIEDFDASTGVDLASIAASGTLSNKKQSFYLYKDGFYNPDVDKIIASVSGKVFDVENYALYQSIMSQVISLLSNPQTQFSVNKIGIQAKMTDVEFLSEAPIISYTLAQIKKKKTCEEIKASLNNNPKAIELVNRTFSAMKMKCDGNAIPEDKQLEAKTYLQGIRVR